MENEKIIFAKAQKGDKKAFSMLVSNYQKYAFNLAFRLVCNEEIAKDIVQDSYIKIWKNIRSYKTEMKFTTWMYKIVTNTAIDYKRRMNNEVLNIDEVANNLTLKSDNPELRITNDELADFIRLATKKLSDKQREVFILKDIQGFSSEEAGRILSQSANNIKSNLYHARKAVKNYLQNVLNLERTAK